MDTEATWIGKQDQRNSKESITDTSPVTAEATLLIYNGFMRLIRIRPNLTYTFHIDAQLSTTHPRTYLFNQAPLCVCLSLRQSSAFNLYLHFGIICSKKSRELTSKSGLLLRYYGEVTHFSHFHFKHSQLIIFCSSFYLILLYAFNNYHISFMISKAL